MRIKTFIEMEKEKEKKTKKKFKKILVYGTIIAGAVGCGCWAYIKLQGTKGGENPVISKWNKLKSGLKKSPEAVTVEKPRPVYVNKNGVAYKK